MTATVLVKAPSNLGLRPRDDGSEPGTWRAPDVLLEEGLHDVLKALGSIELRRPPYDRDEQPGTRLLNGHSLRAFNLELADRIEQLVVERRFPLVLGGDCSILLGALAGLRRLTPLSLVHIDGHSDFRHPGNYDSAATLGAPAGMDLALATGRGEPLLTQWPGVETPLVPDEEVVQIGERENRDPDFAWPDVNETAITRIDTFEANELGPSGVLAKTRATLDRRPWPYWIHLDVDVLDQDVMPAVDSPGSPGIAPSDLELILAGLLEDRRVAGMTVTIYDPELDPERSAARLIVSLLGGAFAKAGRTERLRQ